ncbi:hypothetical protein [Clostridium sp.]|uniref:hypothetical protein n=1 Tax=Clostridium sp. TaxID=1506 RepID=UPI002A9188F2|nr:hypothetical protein [Clostridium sp.]MDY6011666.1 hypothetical protein [Clostridium sp.]
MGKYTQKISAIFNYIKTKKLIISILLITISIPLILLFITRLTPSSNDIRKIDKLAKEISSINSTLDKLNDSNNINSKTAQNELSSIINKLNQVKETSNSLEVEEIVFETKNKFNEALNFNIKLCEQALDMYMNQSSASLDTKLKDYKGTLNSFTESNKSLSTFKISNIMSEDSLKFFDKTYKYFDTLIQVNTLKDINKEKNSSYMLSSDKLITKFKEIDDDLKPALEDIKKNNRDLYILLEDIANKKAIFKDIKNDFYMLSVPEDATELHSSLLKSINTYESYINSIEYVVDSDIDSKESPKQLNEYDNSFIKYNEFMNSLKISIKEFQSFKEK